MTTEERLEKLERELGRARIINRAIVISGFVVLTVICGFASKTTTAQNSVLDMVRAKMFVVVDDDNITRIIMSASENKPMISMFDGSGNGHFIINAFEDAPSITIMNERDRISLGINEFEPSLKCLAMKAE